MNSALRAHLRCTRPGLQRQILAAIRDGRVTEVQALQWYLDNRDLSPADPTWLGQKYRLTVTHFLSYGNGANAPRRPGDHVPAFVRADWRETPRTRHDGWQQTA